MPRYFFHVHHDGVQQDEAGLELPDRAAAWEEATRACGEMIRDLDGTLHVGSDWTMLVADGDDNTLFTIHFGAQDEPRLATSK